MSDVKTAAIRARDASGGRLLLIHDEAAGLELHAECVRRLGACGCAEARGLESLWMMIYRNG